METEGYYGVDKRRPLTSFVSQMNPSTTEHLLSLRDYITQRKKSKQFHSNFNFFLGLGLIFWEVTSMMDF